MSVDNLRISRNKAVVVFTKFTRLYKKNPSALYCFFEGEDSQYYGIRIDNIVGPDKDIDYLSCSGKEGVLGIYRMLSLRKTYANVKTAYFIDRDFDKSINISDIYETPCYSIENFYTSVKCFSKILKSEFKLTELDENFERCLSLYVRLQEEFHDAIELLNIWIACHKDKSNKLNIRDMSIDNFIKLDLNAVTAKYTIDDLSNKFPDIPVISQQELDTKKSELLDKNRQRSFRGKFEIEFLCVFLQKLIEEARKGTHPYFTRNIKVPLRISKKTMISDLSQYAETPTCLISYLESLRIRS